MGITQLETLLSLLVPPPLPALVSCACFMTIRFSIRASFLVAAVSFDVVAFVANSSRVKFGQGMNHCVLAVAVAACLVSVALAGGYRAVPGTGLFTKPSSATPHHQHLFHGANVVHKGPGMYDLAPEDVAEMKTFGFNVVRLGFLWPNVEPQRGQYNDTYVALLRKQADLLWAGGITSFLDMHQDCFSDYFCTNQDGMPHFYGHPPREAEFFEGGNKSFPLPWFKPTYTPNSSSYAPWGQISNCVELSTGPMGWATCYPTFALSAAVQRLYDNNDGVQDALANMWKHVALAFAGHPGVIGYEIINEPWLGKVPLDISELDPVTNPRFWDLWLPGTADRVNLLPFYNNISAAIRSVDNDTAIFFEPASGGNLLDTLPVGFDSGPGGAAYDAAGLNVLSYHIYCPIIESDMPFPQNGSDPIWNILWKAISLGACDALNTVQFDIRKNDVQRLGIGGFMSEWGAFPNSERAASLAAFTLLNMDSLIQSWTFWTWGALKNAAAEVKNQFYRSFPHAVFGSLLRYDNTATTFTMEFVTPASVSSTNSNSSVYLSQLQFPSSLSIAAFPPCCVTTAFNNMTRMLTIKVDTARVMPQSVIRVAVTSA